MYTARFACGYLATVSNAATALGLGLHVCMSTVAEGGSVESKSADASECPIMKPFRIQPQTSNMLLAAYAFVRQTV